MVQYLQKLPWENISCLKPRSVTRMPSLHAVLGHSHLREVHTQTLLTDIHYIDIPLIVEIM